MAGALGIAAALGVVVLGVDRYVLGGRSGGGRPMLRLVARIVVYGALGGLALSLLSFGTVVVLAGTVGFGAAGGWLGAMLDTLGPPSWETDRHSRIEGGTAEVIEVVAGDAGRVLVDDSAERWYLAARPFRGGRYEVGDVVVVVSVRDGVALVAGRDEVGR